MVGVVEREVYWGGIWLSRWREVVVVVMLWLLSMLGKVVGGGWVGR